MNSDYEKVLQLEREGDWEAAHKMVQPFSDQYACLIHAYLHRVEGDLSNARYWYQRAGSDVPDNTLEQEWQRLSRLVNQASKD